MHVAVRALTAFDIEADGRSVTLEVVDAMGSPIKLKLQVDQLGQLAMTLPSLIDAAIRRQYGDSCLRFTYPMESWMVEQASDPSLVIVTMQTTHGLGASFSMSRSKAEEMGRSIAVAVRRELEWITH